MKKPKDPAERRRWKQARRRAAFKKNLSSFVVVTGVCLVIWLVFDRNGSFWPAWVAFGMGIALLFQFRTAYMTDDDQTEREYERLQNEGS